MRNLTHLFDGYGYKPYFVEGDEPEPMHQLMAATLDTVVDEIRGIQQNARARTVSDSGRVWPMIVLRTPKGWTGPKEVDGKPVEGHLALAPGAACPIWHANPEHVQDARRMDAELQARRAL